MPRDRAIVWDVLVGFFLAGLAAAILLQAGAGIAGWDFQTPTGTGGAVGRLLTESATGQEVGGPPIPFPAKVLSQVPFWLMLAGVPLAITRLRGRNIIEDFGLRFKMMDVPVGLVAGVAGQLLLAPAIYWPLRPLLDTADLDQPAKTLTLEATSSTGGVVLLVLMVVVGAPIAEELAYRGALMRSMTERWGPAIGIAGSSTIFGATHFQALQFPALAAIGVVTGLLAYGFDRLGPAVWAHVGFNATAVVALLWL